GRRGDQRDVASKPRGLLSIRRRASPLGNHADAETGPCPLLLRGLARGEPVVVPLAVGLDRLAAGVQYQIFASEPVDALHIQREAPWIPPHHAVAPRGTALSERVK